MVINDAYVERTLIVMQCLDEIFADLPRIGNAPKVKRIKDIKSATDHYVAHQRAVKMLLEFHTNSLKQLRKQHGESYPHDIRIMDQLLWMIGNPDQEVVLAGKE